jgi:hypothetical protein
MTIAFLQNPFEAAEQHPIVAHGETVGWLFNQRQAPDGAAENQQMNVSFAQSGARFDDSPVTHGFTVGYFLMHLRCAFVT